MPNGPTHRTISHIVQVASTPLIFYMDFDQFIALQVGLTVATKITPDLDLYNPLGGVGEFFGLGTYRRMAVHRSGLRLKDWKKLIFRSETSGERVTPWGLVLFSHLPGIGTLIRTVLCCLPVVVLALMFELQSYISPVWLLWIWIGMSAQDAAHSLADLITSHIFAEGSPGWHIKKERQRLKQEQAAAKRAQRMRNMG